VKSLIIFFFQDEELGWMDDGWMERTITQGYYISRLGIYHFILLQPLGKNIYFVPPTPIG
jgi:hypothetical protein